MFVPMIVGLASAQLPFDMVSMKLFTVRDAVARGAVCNDGSPAKFYFRDCPRPAAECLDAPAEWIVVFDGGDSSDACYDGPSCVARAAAEPRKTSSAHLNASLPSPSGIFSWSGEENPNFYQHRTVLVPYCSSDMWLGNSSATFSTAGGGGDGGGGGDVTTQHFHFRGRAILRAVAEDLAAAQFNNRSIPAPGYGPGPNRTRLDAADALAFVGGVGVSSQLAALAARVPPRPAKSLRAICDGCVLVDVPPLVPVSAERPCTAAADCPPAEVLRRGLPLWDPAAAPDAWRKLLGGPLLGGLALPALVQQPQYDQAQLRQNRAWPVDRAPGSAGAAYAQRFAAAVRAALRSRPGGGLFSFGVACSPAERSFFQDSNNFFCRPIANCTVAATGDGGAASTSNLKLTAMASMFLKDPSFQPSCVEACAGFDCNPHCDAPQCWGAQQVRRREMT